ncbi:MAG: hypothetical protein ACTSU4_09295 [Promethearchaeota archaeon]
MEKVEIFWNRLLMKIPGGFFGLISAFIMANGELIALYFFPGYDFFTNMISELGVNGKGAVYFNLALILSGIIAMPFYYTLGEILKESNQLIRKIALHASYISCLTFSLIGMFPARLDNTLILWIHGIMVAISWIMGSVYCFTFSILMLKCEAYSNILAGYGFICSALFLAVLFTWLPIFEWSVTFGIFGYVIVNSLYSFRFKKRNSP